MRMIYCLALCAALVGCRCGSTYVEGTRFTMGVYVPYDGQLYGLQLMEYLAGAAMCVESNETVRIERTFASTNSYMGVTHTQDASHTVIETRSPPDKPTE